jgi:hypothetical protein
MLHPKALQYRLLPNEKLLKGEENLMSSDYGDLKQELKRLGVDVLQVMYADVLGMTRTHH